MHIKLDIGSLYIFVIETGYRRLVDDEHGRKKWRDESHESLETVYSDLDEAHEAMMEWIKSTEDPTDMNYGYSQFEVFSKLAVRPVNGDNTHIQYVEIREHKLL